MGMSATDSERLLPCPFCGVDVDLCKEKLASFDGSIYCYWHVITDRHASQMPTWQLLRDEALRDESGSHPSMEQEGIVMKSVDKLREWANGLHGVYINQIDHTITVTTGWDAPPDMDSVSLCDHINGILDAIEREVADMVPLPLDADGVPIHVGDWITGKWDAKAKVVAITSEDVYWWEPDGCHWCHAYEVRHHHAPTVEDVLYESLRHFGAVEERTPEVDEWLHEQAAKLRLAGGEDA